MKIWWVLLCAPLYVWAADFADLPPRAQVEQALKSHPLVRAAAAGVRAGSAQRDELRAGPHEFSVRLATQRRHDRSVDEKMWDHELGIERTLRLPGKAFKDAELGDLGIEQARYALGDALHESARDLLKKWFDWQREELVSRELAAQATLLEKQHATVLKRVALGDAASLEARLSEAHWMQVRAQQAQADMRRDLAVAELVQQFPGISPSSAVSPGVPEIVPPVPGAGTVWHELLLEHSHELALAHAVARKSRLMVQRLEANRLPDPTVGLVIGRERNGLERVIGLQLTVPLPGSARDAAARGSVAEADAAHAREALVRARVEVEAQRVLQRARVSVTQWQRLHEVALRMEENAGLLEKAWRLGEGQFAELQTARRQAIEASLAATQAQLEANEARYRLLLDAHLLWDLDAETGEHDTAEPDLRRRPASADLRGG